MSVVLELKNLSKSFGTLNILHEINFSLSAGQSAAILGPSGAGKSTLLHISGLMEKPTSGSIFINGKEMGALSDDARAKERLDTIGFLFQFHYLLPDFDVLENVLIPVRLAGEDLTEASSYAQSILKRLGLLERLRHKPHQLSGGEQQRVGLARALIRRPKLLLCDEPTGNLDLHTAEQVSQIIYAEAEQQGIATVVVTHNEVLAKRAHASYHLMNGTFSEQPAGSKR